ncbi:MAG: helix-hairpin-helix domain-containing protein [Bacteriovoracales bacterium]|nr:helix-hairpin-helix domain-containing protein [Bacteriovoracales bacterium]
MIGYLQGKVLFSDGHETILLTSSGTGYQVKTFDIFPEGQTLGLYISHMVKENSEELFGFLTMREKKLFELILSVKGVGPKGAYALVYTLGFQGFIKAIGLEDKKALQRSPGIGAKAAAQILLDLSAKIEKVSMYSDRYSGKIFEDNITSVQEKLSHEREEEDICDPASPHALSLRDRKNLLDDALLACEELGFKPEKINLIAQKLLSEHDIKKSEQLVHLILKDI